MSMNVLVLMVAIVTQGVKTLLGPTDVFVRLDTPVMVEAVTVRMALFVQSKHFVISNLHLYSCPYPYTSLNLSI